MTCYKEIYGNDIDGNRGTEVVHCEIDAEDTEEICKQLYDEFLDGYTTGQQTVYLTNTITGSDVEFQVFIEDYFKELKEMALNDETLKDDQEIQDWLQVI